jgi:hypothetical protein
MLKKKAYRLNGKPSKYIVVNSDNTTIRHPPLSLKVRFVFVGYLKIDSFCSVFPDNYRDENLISGHKKSLPV